MSSLNPGDRLAGRFLLVRRLGAGATSACWLAEDLEARARRVLKIADGAAPKALLDAEAELLTRLAHPGIVASHGTVIDGDRLLLVTDYLPGGDFGALRGGLWPQAVAALEPALAGLAHAHARGVAHGDLKPANLVRAADGGARLVDFGVAAAALAGGTSRGSPFSRSPAQWQGAPAEPADDLWGLGATLYELVAGSPPFYPAVDADRVARDTPPVPTGAPPQLAVLIARLLSKEPAGRGDLAEARSALAALVASVPAAAPRPSGPVSPPPRALAPAGWRPAAVTAPGASPRASPRSPALLIGVPLLLAAVVGVFVILPRWVREHPPEVSVEPSKPSPILAAREAAAPKALPSTPEGLAELARAKTRAEEARAAFEKLRAPLDGGHAELWGGADYARMSGTANDAAARYSERDYAAAAAAWAVAAELVPRIQTARAPALAEALKQGHSAFERADAPAATAAFERALAIEPTNAAARAGLGRAQHLDAVTALVDAGAEFERHADLDAAAAKYRAALALDPATTAASAGLARLAARAKSTGFAQAMAQGQKALAAGDRARARTAFERALTIQPGAAEAKDALGELALGDQTAAIARQRATAEAAVRDERWADAVRAYDAALALDSTLVFATAGKAQAEPRALLASRIDRLLAAPSRLDSPESRRSARALIAEAEDAAAAGPAPVLRRQSAALERAITVAETPVRVTLVSDNLTEVVVYRVARLGVFAARELELLPGRYTIVGRRAGFRDVRREIEVAPGAEAPPVDVRCTDPI
jgi:eukaryotic-like serine/threonine-protein kinase